MSDYISIDPFDEPYRMKNPNKHDHESDTYCAICVPVYRMRREDSNDEDTDEEVEDDE